MTQNKNESKMRLMGCWSVSRECLCHCSPAYIAKKSGNNKVWVLFCIQRLKVWKCPLPSGQTKQQNVIAIHKRLDINVYNYLLSSPIYSWQMEKVKSQKLHHHVNTFKKRHINAFDKRLLLNFSFNQHSKCWFDSFWQCLPEKKNIKYI